MKAPTPHVLRHHQDPLVFLRQTNVLRQQGLNPGAREGDGQEGGRRAAPGRASWTPRPADPGRQLGLEHGICPRSRPEHSPGTPTLRMPIPRCPSPDGHPRDKG